MRQLLADKVSGQPGGPLASDPRAPAAGNMGPALRLEWSIRRTGRASLGTAIDPRGCAVHHRGAAATGPQSARFELANGLPFVASDMAMHGLLGEHTVAEAQRLQVALGQIRRASGDYAGKLLAIDPHRIQSYSKRQMRRYREMTRSPNRSRWPQRSSSSTPTRSSRCVSPQPPRPGPRPPPRSNCSELAAEILTPQPGETLVLADLEHLSAELFDQVQLHTPIRSPGADEERTSSTEATPRPFLPSSSPAVGPGLPPLSDPTR